MSCFAEAMRLDLRRNALWMALAALLIFLLAPLAGMSAQMTARQTARAVEAASALAGVAALCGLFFPERERGVREAIAARGVPLWTVWAARAVWLPFGYRRAPPRCSWRCKAAKFRAAWPWRVSQMPPLPAAWPRCAPRFREAWPSLPPCLRFGLR